MKAEFTKAVALRSEIQRGVVQLIATDAPARIVSQTVRQRPLHPGLVG